MVRKRNLFAATVLFVAFVLGSAAAWAAEEGLAGLLTSRLGVTEKQAEGGTGSLLNYARGKLSENDFAKVAQAIPGVGKYLDAAPKPGVTAGAAGAASSLLGGKKEGGGLLSLAGQFAELGLGSDMIGKFVPIIVSYVKSSGGEAVAGLLAGALK
jgi:hypothetical protein